MKDIDYMEAEMQPGIEAGWAKDGDEYVIGYREGWRAAIEAMHAKVGVWLRSIEAAHAKASAGGEGEKPSPGPALVDGMKQLRDRLAEAEARKVAGFKDKGETNAV